MDRTLQDSGNSLPVFVSFCFLEGDTYEESVKKNERRGSFGFVLCLEKGASTDSIIIQFAALRLHDREYFFR